MSLSGDVATARLTLPFAAGAELSWPAVGDPPNPRCAPGASDDCGVDWDEQIARYDRRVVMALVARGVALDEAQEIAQEAWIRLVEQHRGGQLERLSLPGLAIRQAYFLASDRRRKQARRGDLARRHAGAGSGGVETIVDALDERRAPDVERQLDARADLRIVLDVVASRGHTARAVFDGLYGPRAAAPAELARELGISVQRVRQVACELRAAIRKRMGAP